VANLEYDLEKLSQVNINYLNRSTTSNEVEAVMKSLLRKKIPRQHGFTANFYWVLKKIQINVPQTFL
jgi:hypothetical protein